MQTFATAPHVSYDIRRGRIGSIPDPRLQTLAQYWFDRADLMAAGASALPSRASIDPLDLRALLPNLMLLERSGEPPQERYQFRLVGTDIRQFTGRELTGQYLDAVLPESYHDYVRMLNRLAHDAARPVYSSSLYHDEGDFVNGITYRLVMPLRGMLGPILFVCQYWQRRQDRGYWTGDWRSATPEISVIESR